MESVFQERTLTVALLWWNFQADPSPTLVKEGFSLGKLRKSSNPLQL
jgi:hypothetical protein